MAAGAQAPRCWLRCHPRDVWLRAGPRSCCQPPATRTSRTRKPRLREGAKGAGAASSPSCVPVQAPPCPGTSLQDVLCPHPPGHMLRDWDTCCTPGVQHRGPKSKGTSYSPEGLWGLGPAGGVAGHDPEADQLQEPGGSGWVRHEGNRAWNQLPDTQADRPAAPPGSGDEGHLCACRGYLPGSVFTLACPSASTLGEHRAQAAATGCVPSPKPTIPCGAVAAGGALGALSRGRGPRQWDWWVS